MTIGYSDVIERVSDAASSLGETERRDAHRVVELCRRRDAWMGGNESAEMRRELGRLAEVLGRRGARALPAAALARALLADLAGRRDDSQQALADCDQKLTMFGL